MIKKGGYVQLDCEGLVLDGVENTLAGISKKVADVYALNKPILATNLKLKKALTGLSSDVEVSNVYCSISIANNVYVLTCMVASMNININITKTTNKYQGIKF